MSTRPQWAKRLGWMADDVIDPKYDWPEGRSPEQEQADRVLDEVEAAIKAILCREFGHEIEDDQCMKPEHRYCPWCGLRETTIDQNGENQ
jgi:hypothetical protein